MWFFMVSNLIYVIVLSDMILMNESKTMKRYKRRNEDLLNNLNSTFTTLMNIMMVDTNENAQLSKEITKEFPKEQFYNGESMQTNDYQDIIANNSVYNQQLTGYDSGYNNQISGRSFEQSPSFSGYFNQQSTVPKSSASNSYGNQIIQHQNNYISQEQLANAPTYMDSNPSDSQIEINQGENAPSSNLIVDDNFNQISSSSLLENSQTKSSNYLSNYSDMSKYGKIKVSDFGSSTEPTILKNKHFYELISDDNNVLSMNDFKKPTTLSSNAAEEKKSSFRSFSPEYDLDQFRMPSNSPKLETTSNYFDKVNTKETIPAQPNFSNKNYNNPSNSLPNSLSNNFANNLQNNYNVPSNQVTVEQHITPNNPALNNKLINHNPGYTNSHFQIPVAMSYNQKLPSVMSYNQNTPVGISAQVPAQKNGYSSFASYGGHGDSSYGSLDHGGGAYSSYASYGGLSMPMQSYSYSMPIKGYSSGSYGSLSHGGGGYSSYGGHDGYEQIPKLAGYNLKANINAKITPTISHGTHSIMSYIGSGSHGGGYSMPIKGYSGGSYGSLGHGSYSSYGGHGGGYGGHSAGYKRM